MNRFMIYGFATIVFVGALVASLERSQINAIRQAVGLDLLFESEAPAVGRGIEEAIEEVAAEPVPGLLDDPTTLGAVAEAVAGCVPARAPPSEAVLAGLRRYVLALAAIGLEPEHPLAEPRARALYPLLGQGPMAAVDAARSERLTARQQRLLADLHMAFRDPDHPLYRGLPLHSGTLQGMSFQEAADALAHQWQQVATCAEERTLSPLAQWEPLPVE